MFRLETTVVYMNLEISFFACLNFTGNKLCNFSIWALNTISSSGVCNQLSLYITKALCHPLHHLLCRSLVSTLNSLSLCMSPLLPPLVTFLHSDVVLVWWCCMRWRWHMDSWKTSTHTLGTIVCCWWLVGFYGSLLGAWGAKLTKQSAAFYFLFIVVVKVIWKMQGFAVYGACRLYSQHMFHQT